ncbi:guanine deaminase [Pedobacter glucosidilyticus]|uniref:Nucleoside deaminase n=1 Tax=Pedobacter aquae TaxID=2605747 RepID=A0A5C0VCJ5_9SPHI|nr:MULTISPECIES: nucleoside deaminase [Pedobacter]KHJ38482.1 guanine deaminase [Pedobacter glucosidilyticus]QEK50505.1 nucleoside deaminase [Pedobacter aquae]
MEHEDFMRMAIALSEDNVKNNLGGPFGAVIVKDGQIIAKSANTVTTTNDPTAHAEVAAIRLACHALNTFSLEGCTIYASCEPCPMCLGAIYWARIDKLYYANTKRDAAAINFDDDFIYQEIDLKPEDRKLPSQQLLRDEALKAFEMWQLSANKTDY